MGLLSSCVHKVYQKRNFVNNQLYQRQTIRCQSNGNRASLVSDLLPQPAKLAPSELPTPTSRGRLCCWAGLAAPSYTRILGMSIPLLTHTS